MFLDHLCQPFYCTDSSKVRLWCHPLCEGLPLWASLCVCTHGHIPSRASLPSSLPTAASGLLLSHKSFAINSSSAWTIYCFKYKLLGIQDCPLNNTTLTHSHCNTLPWGRGRASAKQHARNIPGTWSHPEQVVSVSIIQDECVEGKQLRTSF